MPVTTQTNLETKKWKFIDTNYAANDSFVTITWDNGDTTIPIDNMIVGSMGFIESGGQGASYEIYKDGYLIASGTIVANLTAAELIQHVGEEIEVKIKNTTPGSNATVTTKFFGK